MSDRQSASDLNAAAAGRALRELPLAAPPDGGWDALATSLRAQGLVRDSAVAGKTASAGASGDPAAHSSATARPGRIRAARPRRGRRWVPAALAGGLALLAIALLPGSRDAAAPTPTAHTAASATVPGAHTAPDSTAELRRESGRIEEWLRTLKADETPLDGRSLMAATEIEDMIGLIDLQLAAGSDTGSDTHALWHNRVALLRDLAAVRTTYSLAGTGMAANGNAAAPHNGNTL